MGRGCLSPGLEHTVGENHMADQLIECAFARLADVQEAEELVHLAFIAACGIYSEPRLRMTTRYKCCEETRIIQIDTGTPEGESVGAIFIAFADRAFDLDSYTLKTIQQTRSSPKE